MDLFLVRKGRSGFQFFDHRKFGDLLNEDYEKANNSWDGDVFDIHRQDLNKFGKRATTFILSPKELLKK